MKLNLLTAESKKKFREMWEADVPVAEMARHFDCSRSHISNLAKEFGLPKREWHYAPFVDLPVEEIYRRAAEIRKKSLERKRSEGGDKWNETIRQRDTFSWNGRNFSRLVGALVLVLVACNVADARPRRRSTGSFAAVPAGHSNASAQDVAKACAAMGRLAHIGGNSGPEGLGMGPTRKSAYRNCCFANSGIPTVDVGYAQMKNGYWCCCRRYRR
jgi:hypothetical protein